MGGVGGDLGTPRWVAGVGVGCGLGGPRRPFPPHSRSAPGGLPVLLCKQPIWAAGDTPHLMPVEHGLPWHPVATGLAGRCLPCACSPILYFLIPCFRCLGHQWLDTHCNTAAIAHTCTANNKRQFRNRHFVIASPNPPPPPPKYFRHYYIHPCYGGTDLLDPCSWSALDQYGDLFNHNAPHIGDRHGSHPSHFRKGQLRCPQRGWNSVAGLEDPQVLLWP